jgi:hypothetical protein
VGDGVQEFIFTVLVYQFDLHFLTVPVFSPFEVSIVSFVDYDVFDSSKFVAPQVGLSCLPSLATLDINILAEVTNMPRQ